VVAATGTVFIKGGTSALATMKLNTANAPAGIGPLITIADASHKRLQFGNLAGITNSAAHQGGRLTDANGALLADSIGLNATMSQLATNSASGTASLSATTTDVSGLTGTITTSRTVNVLFFGQIGGYYYNNSGTGLIAISPDISLILDSVATATAQAVFPRYPNPSATGVIQYSNASFFWTVSVPAGSWNFHVHILNASANWNFNYNPTLFYAFQLGG
jgi:hypothetical protein